MHQERARGILVQGWNVIMVMEGWLVMVAVQVLTQVMGVDVQCLYSYICAGGNWSGAIMCCVVKILTEREGERGPAEDGGGGGGVY